MAYARAAIAPRIARAAADGARGLAAVRAPRARAYYLLRDGADGGATSCAVELAPSSSPDARARRRLRAPLFGGPRAVTATGAAHVRALLDGGARPVTVGEIAFSEGKLGHRCWPSSVALAQWMATAPDAPATRAPRVLELGAGCGLVGLACSRGARGRATTTTTPPPPPTRDADADAADVAGASSRSPTSTAAATRARARPACSRTSRATRARTPSARAGARVAALDWTDRSTWRARRVRRRARRRGRV